MNNALMNAILSMDAYNRGYNAAIPLTGNTIGEATIVMDSSVLLDTNLQRLDIPASFYAVAYQMPNDETWGGKTIISYRGTDQAPDLFAALQSGDWSKFLTADVMNGYGLGAGSPTNMAK